MGARQIRFIVVIQGILFFGHWLLFETWTFFWRISNPATLTGLAIALALLSVSFLTATLVAARSSNLAARIFYRCAVVWLGFLNFLFWAAWLCWIVYGIGMLLGASPSRFQIAAILFGLAILAGLYGAINAAYIRRTWVTIPLANLPQSWSGRVAAHVSDAHLGHVHGAGFLRRIVRILEGIQPDLVFLTGDLFDGTKVNAQEMVHPWKGYAPPLGTYFVTGNHEEFRDSSDFLKAIRNTGIRVLENEKIEIDGVDLVGIFDRDLKRLGPTLDSVGVDHVRPSILLAHRPRYGPDGLAQAASAGIALQLSGHTHGGQVPPFTWITRRIFRQYTRGAHRFQDLTVCTSMGAGTWGPPMRVGTKPEILFIRFERVPDGVDAAGLGGDDGTEIEI